MYRYRQNIRKLTKASTKQVKSPMISNSKSFKKQVKKQGSGVGAVGLDVGIIVDALVGATVLEKSKQVIL